MLKQFVDAFIERLLVKVFGHYAHPYALTFSVPVGGLASGYRHQKQIKFIGSYSGAVELAKQHLRAGRVTHASIHTRAGVRVWEGSAE